MDKQRIDEELIDEAVLALMFLTVREDPSGVGLSRAWKSFDWDAMDRLHEKDLIMDPRSKAKSVLLTEEGRRRSEAAFQRLFVRTQS